jgi:hypothetical protein
VRRQLGQSPRGCAPCDEGLLAAAREPAQAKPRTPGPAVRPPRLDLTAVARGGRGWWCGPERAGGAGGAAPSRLRAREEELVRLMRAVVAHRGGGTSSPEQLVKDLIVAEKGPAGPSGGGGGPRLLRVDGLETERRAGDAEAALRFLFRGLAVPRHGVAVFPGAAAGLDGGGARAGCAFVAVEGADDALAALNRAALRGVAASESSLDELCAARLVVAAAAATATPRLRQAAADGHGLLAALHDPGPAPSSRGPGSGGNGNGGWAGPAAAAGAEQKVGQRRGRLASAGSEPGGGWSRPGRVLLLQLGAPRAGPAVGWHGPWSGLPVPPRGAGPGHRPSTVPTAAPAAGGMEPAA